MGAEEEEDDLRSALDDSLRRARRAAAGKADLRGEAAVAEEVAGRRLQDEADMRQRAASNDGGACLYLTQSTSDGMRSL